MPFDGTNPTVVDEVAIILRARHVLIRDGWCQNQLHNQWGNHCVIGALCVAKRELTNSGGLNDVLAVPVFKSAYTIQRSLGTKRPLGVWNDSRKRNEEEVLLVLKLAADWATERKLRGSVGARIKAAVLRIFRTAQATGTYDFGDVVSRVENTVARDAESEPPALATDDTMAHREMENA